MPGAPNPGDPAGSEEPGSSPPVPASSKTRPQIPLIDDSSFFEAVLDRLKPRPAGSHLIITIPVWGWTGDGKTCVLLTAIHYCDPTQHPLGLALVSDPDELSSLENLEEYRGLNLVSIAGATTDRLRELSAKFIDVGEWPPGTDEPSAYLLAIRSVRETLGYVVFPDLKGGSYREIDESARDVLSRAHAAVLLVNPELYEQTSTDGKRYRDEILGRLQQFRAAGVSACVMITKADLHQGAHEASDSTQKHLTVVVERLAEGSSDDPGLRCLLCRVSVIGLDKQLLDGDRLPPAQDRIPDALIRAWIWILAEGLSRPPEEIRSSLPPLHVRTGGDHSPAVGVKIVPELRQVGDFSSAPGVAICSTRDERDVSAFAFLSSEAELTEVSFTVPSIGKPALKSLGALPDWPADTKAQGIYLDGRLLIGPRSTVNALWVGVMGNNITKTPLPFELVAWTAVAGRRIVGVDAAGRLSSFVLEADRWQQRDYVEGFIPASPAFACTYVSQLSQTFVFNGSAVAGVATTADGMFADRVTPDLVCQYDGANPKTNRLGHCLGTKKGTNALLSAAGQPIELGPVLAPVDDSLALAPEAALVAIVSPEKKLTAVAIQRAQVTRSLSSPTVATVPAGMAWSARGDFLVASFGDGTWCVYRPFGFPK